MDFLLPNVTLTAVGSLRKYNFTQLNQPTLLIIQNEHSIEIAAGVNEIVRFQFPLTSQLNVFSIADLQYVPKLFKPQVDAELLTAYENAASSLPSFLNAEDYIVILPDWMGSVPRSLNIRPNSRKPSVAVVDAENKVIGKYTGNRVADAALMMIDELEIV